MKFSFLGLDIFFKKTRDEDLLTLKDINYTNDNVIEYLKKLNSDEINKRVEEVTCDINQGFEKIKQILFDKGIVIIPDYIPHDSIDQISKDLKIIKEKISAFVSSEKSFEEKKDILYQQENFKIKQHSELIDYSKAVANVRQAQDKGMIDIFNIDKWYPSIGNILRPYFNNKIIKETINEANSSLKTKNLNLYVSNGVTKTRGFHVDGYQKELKGFIYLEDCHDLKYGPYTYVKESHLDIASQKINKQISSSLPNSTETPFILLHNIVPALAKKGALVISDQKGSHRGFPQTKGYQRTVAVMNFV